MDLEHVFSYSLFGERKQKGNCAFGRVKISQFIYSIYSAWRGQPCWTNLTCESEVRG